MRIYLIVGAICFSFGLFSCSESKTTEKTSEESPPELHLSEMMRLMYNDMLVNRKKIIDGENDLYFSFQYSTIFDAKATTPENSGKQFYQDQLNQFIDLQSKLKASRNNLDRKELFNSMRNTCISCHEQYCIGPLRKIRKIHLFENQLLNQN